MRASWPGPMPRARIRTSARGRPKTGGAKAIAQPRVGERGAETRPNPPEGAPRQPGALKLLSGDANPELAKKIADALHEPLDEMRITRFADGEYDVKIAQ